MKKILIVAMADSVHTARWLEQFEGSQHKFVLFPSSPHRRIHPKISYLLSGSSEMNIRIPAGLKQTGLVLAIIDKFFANRVRGALLRRQITKINPDILHALETQGAGYISLAAIKKIQRRPFFILTQWGSDFYWYRRFPKHEKKIKNLLSHIDLLSMECNRDITISRELSYIGKIFPPYVYTGGYKIQSETELNTMVKTSLRKTIMVKGHTRFVGRGLEALLAIEKLSHLLKNYEIIIYSADLKARRQGNFLRKKFGLSIVSYRRGELLQEEIIKLFQKSRIYVGISLSDGASMSLLEAMVCGTFPIQTDTSCADEWIINGQSGFIVSPDNVPNLVNSLRVALEDDLLVDHAADLNYAVARRRLDQTAISQITQNFYSPTN